MRFSHAAFPRLRAIYNYSSLSRHVFTNRSSAPDYGRLTVHTKISSLRATTRDLNQCLTTRAAVQVRPGRERL